MGRYTTIQAYADNNPQQRVVDYAQATGQKEGTDASASAAAARGPVVHEKVDNPYGSTAGAGSGEFHVYRHARAREMARWKKINEVEAEKKADEEFNKKLEDDTNEEARKTEKRRRKRERQKEAKRRKKNMKLGGVGGDISNDQGGDKEDEEEFSYEPVAAAEIALKSNDTKDIDEEKKIESSAADVRKQPPEEVKLPFANDGSFLERMKKELASAE